MPATISPWLAIGPGGLLALGSLTGALICLGKKRLIDDLPTSKTQGVFMGLAELKGTAESDTPLTSYLAEKPCVQYSWKVEEHWSRTVTSTHRDAKGNMHTTTRTESGWKNVSGGGEAKSFYLKDDTGVIRINPEGAAIQGSSVFNQTCGRGDPLYFGKGPAFEIANSTHRRRFIETAVPLHAVLYVLGQARERDDIVAAEIAQDKRARMFMISVRSEKQISRGYGTWSVVWLVLGLIIALGSGAGWAMLSGPERGFNWLPVAIMAIAYLVIFLVAWLWSTYNNLINLHHSVERGWSEVDVQLKRRRDLIPNLVQVVESFKQYERNTQQVITEMRAQGPVNGTQDGSTLKGLAASLWIVAENYPEIKASETFLKLQHSLVDTEQRIALARDYYNDVTTFYNTRLAIIPQRYVAAIARLRPQNLMDASDFERAPVNVKLVS